jgi:hypothetical protein
MRWILIAGPVVLLAAGGAHRPSEQAAPVVIPLDGTRGLTLIRTRAHSVVSLAVTGVYEMVD